MTHLRHVLIAAGTRGAASNYSSMMRTSIGSPPSGSSLAGPTVASAGMVTLHSTGQVYVNGGAFSPLAPFGGRRQSGTGREMGVAGVEEFTEFKAILT